MTGPDEGAEANGPDGRTRLRMTLMGMAFEVSWLTAKAAIVRRKGIELREAIRILDDRDVALEYVPDRNQFRAVGRSPDGRILTVAIDITYPDEEEKGGDVGLIRVYTAWEASNAERAFYLR